MCYSGKCELEDHMGNCTLMSYELKEVQKEFKNAKASPCTACCEEEDNDPEFHKARKEILDFIYRIKYGPQELKRLYGHVG